MTDNEKCLQAIASLDGKSGHYVFPCQLIARMTGMTYRKVRGIMQKLEAAGYAIKNQEGGVDGWTGRRYCRHGYSITKEGKEKINGRYADFAMPV